MNREQVKEILDESLNELSINDSYLIENDVNERTICAHLANYLEPRAKAVDSELSVDCEYNKNGNDQKRLDSRERGVYPDIIVHKRGSNEKNQIVIEVKKAVRHNLTNRQIRSDLCKVRRFTSNNDTCPYHFEFGFFIVIKYNEVSHTPFYELREFIEGQEVIRNNTNTMISI